MTHLLGRRDCVESLRRDVIDLQAAVLDVFSRTGPVRVPSWKFPDKVSCNVDLVQLLQEYDYTEGETEFNQHSHIVLLELVIDSVLWAASCGAVSCGQRPVGSVLWGSVLWAASCGQRPVGQRPVGQRPVPTDEGLEDDQHCTVQQQMSMSYRLLICPSTRLMLLFQSFNVYTESMTGGQRAGQTGPSVSIGPVVNRYWNNLVQLSSQQRRGGASNDSTQRSSSSATPKTIPQTDHPSTARTTQSASAFKPSTPQHTPQASCIPSRTAPPAGPPPSRSVSAQTVESALVPCAACARVQSSLKESAEACVSLCRSLGLTSFLEHFLVAVEDTGQLGRLTASDVAQWACEQRRDMGRIGKHITEVNETLGSLRDGLRKAEEEREDLRAQLEREEQRAGREREERRTREDEWESRLQEVKTSGEEVQRRLQQEQEELKRGVKTLELRVSELTGELELQRETQQGLQCERDSLVEEVHSLRLQEVRWREEEEDRRRELETELRNTNTLLDKESAKYRSAQRQHEAMQVKQRALLKRVDALVQQCEDLQDRLEGCEDEKAELSSMLTQTTQERDTLQEQLTQQTSQCQSLSEERQCRSVRERELEDSVHRLKEDLQQAAQRERILVAFPELNSQHTVPQSTGDVLCDMEQQLKANSLRIRVLEQENRSLSNSLAKLRAAGWVSTLIQARGDQPGRPDSGGQAGGRRETAAVLETGVHPTSSPASVVQQTLCLSLSPNAAETYSKLRQAARSRSAGSHRRKK
ncbi:hypothetical protein NFI96_011271 [Prochilodus magdalenae]|nr:hypothetical protein NFI96_011271 [Prochilodus magdalenae]